jgi:arylsulfatase A-like enzyme
MRLKLRASSAGRWIPWSLLLLVSCGPTGSSTLSPGPSHPQIVLISFDTCRADVFGVLTGEQPSLTPRLDEFAADSVVFENAFAQFPHTLPSHMSLFTSAYPDVHGVKPDLDPLPPSIRTLPEILHDGGYRTVGLVTSEWLKPDFGFGRGFDHYERLHHGQTYADRVNSAALLELTSPAPAVREPRFLFLHYYDLHSDFRETTAGSKLPYFSPPAYRDGLDVSADGREFCDAEQRCNTRYLIAADVERRPLPQSEIDTIHQLYRAAVPLLDAQMGAFFDELKKHGLYESSLIVVTSDHGEEFREHGRFIHSQPYDETIHVPLFIKFPGSRWAGTRVSEVVETVDIAPTVLDLLGIEPPETFQGESLLDLVERRPGHRKRAVYSQDSITATRYSLRTSRTKLILNLSSSKMEFYDLQTDPDERADLSAHKTNLTGEMERRLKRRIRANRTLHQELAVEADQGGEPLSPKERERLRALGYLN